MRLLGQILLACILFSVLQALVAAFVIAIMLLLLWGLLFRTRETVGLIALFAFLNALAVHPWATIGAIAVLIGCVWVASRLEPGGATPDQPVALLPGPRTDPADDP